MVAPSDARDRYQVILQKIRALKLGMDEDRACRDIISGGRANDDGVDGSARSSERCSSRRVSRYVISLLRLVETDVGQLRSDVDASPHTGLGDVETWKRLDQLVSDLEWQLLCVKHGPRKRKSGAITQGSDAAVPCDINNHHRSPGRESPCSITSMTSSFLPEIQLPVASGKGASPLDRMQLHENKNGSVAESIAHSDIRGRDRASHQEYLPLLQAPAKHKPFSFSRTVTQSYPSRSCFPDVPSMVAHSRLTSLEITTPRRPKNRRKTSAAWRSITRENTWRY